MIVPFFLLMISLAGVGLAVFLPPFHDLMLLAGPCAIASLVLLLRAGFSPAARTQRHAPKLVFPRRLTSRRKRRLKSAGKMQPTYLVLDGSNVMHWKEGTPQLDTLRDVVQHLTRLGFSPGVVFDANAGHLLAGKYQHHRAMGKHLGLPEGQVMVVDKGTPADPIILAAARDLGARIVSNDRYKDWADQHPEVREVGHLIKGGYANGKLLLDLDKMAGPPTKA